MPPPVDVGAPRNDSRRVETEKQQGGKPHGQARIVTKFDDIAELVGAHAGGLRAIFESAPPSDPGELGDAPRGLLLGVVGIESVHLALRPLVRSLSRAAEPVWHGIMFDHGGNSGENRVLGRSMMRFRAEHAPSLLDGRAALVLTYDKSPWPVRALRDELRTIGPGMALGATFVGGRLAAFFGLSVR